MSDLKQGEKREIAEYLVRRSMRIGKKSSGDFDSVSILYNGTDPSCREFALMVEEECWKVGAYTLIREYSSARSRLKHQLLPEESLKRMDPISKAIAETVDVRIFIGEEDDPSWSEGLQNKIKLTGENRQKLFEIMDKRGMRWVYFGWPIPGAARAYGISQDRFREIFINSIRMSFKEEMLDLCNFYSKALRGADRIRIVSEDTDLSFSIRGRPVIVDDAIISDDDIVNGDVGLNIPSGEVFVAPLETSADGYISFPIVVVPGFGKVVNLRINFQGGKVTSFEAEEGEGRLKAFFDSNTGDIDRIAELGIGCNPGAEFTNGCIIVDEKIYKTIHLAVGNNTGSYHGTNKASAHLDMIKPMERGILYVDGKVVIENGVPVKE